MMSESDLIKYIEKNYEVANKLAKLDLTEIINELKSAKLIKVGYYYNKSNEYIRIKDYCITNNSKVMIQYILATNKGVSREQSSAVNFSRIYFNLNSPDKLLKPISESKFDKFINKFINSIKIKCTYKLNVNDYLKVAETLQNISD